MARSSSVFISHRHADRRIATALRGFIDQWGRKEVSVFQSSAEEADSPRLGYTLSAELKQALWDAGVVLLVYTSDDPDWSYCMWECGVATKPTAPPTRIIVLQCGADVPRVFADQVRVDVRNRVDVGKFVKAFLTDPTFFPEAGAAVAPRLSPDGPEVAHAAADLHARLAKVIPRREVAEWLAQPQLRLELDMADLPGMAGGTASRDELGQRLRVRDMDPRAWHIFGIASAQAIGTLGDLVRHWRQSRAEAPLGWVDDLQAQIVHGARGEVPGPGWAQLQEVDSTERYTPVLTRVRQLPAQEVLQFDVTLVPFEPARVMAGIDDPVLQAYLQARVRVDAAAQGLAPQLAPIAVRCFSDWSSLVARVASGEGGELAGPERLEITRLLAQVHKKHMLIERVVGSPKAAHSGDWLAFYTELGRLPDVDKTWLLCVDLEQARAKADEVEAAWHFFSERHFKTLYCAPGDVARAIGTTVDDAVHGHEVIEDFGGCIKLVSLPEGSYTAGAHANRLRTSFLPVNPDHRRLLSSMLDCAVPITRAWLRALASHDAGAAPINAAAGSRTSG